MQTGHAYQMDGQAVKPQAIRQGHAHFLGQARRHVLAVDKLKSGLETGTRAPETGDAASPRHNRDYQGAFAALTAISSPMPRGAAPS